MSSIFCNISDYEQIVPVFSANVLSWMRITWPEDIGLRSAINPVSTADATSGCRGLVILSGLPRFGSGRKPSCWKIERVWKIHARKMRAEAASHRGFHPNRRFYKGNSLTPITFFPESLWNQSHPDLKKWWREGIHFAHRKLALPPNSKVLIITETPLWGASLPRFLSQMRFDVTLSGVLTTCHSESGMV